MHHRSDLTGILGCSPVIGVKHKELVRASGKILAWPILVAALMHNDQPARLAGIIGLGVF
jgi:hypothetical protein